jgi:hypothetical protein
VSIGDLLSRLVAKLDAAAIPHMLAGSFASTYHGIPRTTQDVDIVVDLTGAKLQTLLGSLRAEEYYVDTDAAQDALRRRTQFNIIDMETGWKVDLIIRKDRPFSIEEFDRRQPAELFGTKVFVATAEDSIVAKLEWAKLGDSERQLRDVAGIVASRGEALDVAHIEKWVKALGLQDLWARVRVD